MRKLNSEVKQLVQGRTLQVKLIPKLSLSDSNNLIFAPILHCTPSRSGRNKGDTQVETLNDFIVLNSRLMSRICSTHFTSIPPLEPQTVARNLSPELREARATVGRGQGYLHIGSLVLIWSDEGWYILSHQSPSRCGDSPPERQGREKASSQGLTVHRQLFPTNSHSSLSYHFHPQATKPLLTTWGYLAILETNLALVI